jgi:hypothetical protein
MAQMAEGIERPPSPWPYTARSNSRSKTQVWTAPHEDDANNAVERHSIEADSCQHDGSSVSDSLSADEEEEGAATMYQDDDDDQEMLVVDGTLLPGELDVGWARAHDR